MLDRLFYKEQLVLFSGLLLFTSKNVLGISQEENSRTFVRMSNKQLITSIQPNVVLEERMVPNSMKCGQWCLRNSLCLSFNFEKEQSKLQQNEMKCELLSVDGKLRPDLVRESNAFEHFAISDPCLNCLHGGSCVISKSQYQCICADGFQGTRCEIISECVHYRTLSEDNRNIKYGLVARKCDHSSIISSGKWYRFIGPAGSRMLDTCPTSRCDTDFQGWLKEGQPSPGEVRVNRTVCFKGNGKCCKWPKPIKVTHCGAFVVYQLKPLNCNIRYCGTD